MWSIGDSNPRRGDYENGVYAFIVIFGCLIGAFLLVLMFFTGHWRLAVTLIALLAFLALLFRGLRSTGGGD